jgi:hypothetical protein
LLGHSWSSHPLKLLWISCFWLWATQAFSRSEALAMEMSAKGGRWGGGQQDGGGRWVGRKKGGRWVGVGRSFQAKTWGQGWAKKKVIRKLFPEKKKLS